MKARSHVRPEQVRIRVITELPGEDPEEHVVAGSEAGECGKDIVAAIRNGKSPGEALIALANTASSLASIGVLPSQFVPIRHNTVGPR
jgi:hypothetical protein